MSLRMIIKSWSPLKENTNMHMPFRIIIKFWSPLKKDLINKLLVVAYA